MPKYSNLVSGLQRSSRAVQVGELRAMNRYAGLLLPDMDIFTRPFSVRAGAWHWILLGCMVLTLCACEATGGSSAAAPVDPVTAVSAPATSTDAIVGDMGVAKRALNCPPPAPTFTSLHGRFGVVQCELFEDGPEVPAEFQFVHRGPDGDTVAVQPVSREILSATVDETEPRFWGGHILTLDLPQERGGVLLIANWIDNHFALSSYPYDSGEEDGLQLEWRDGAFLVTTSTDGQRRLFAGDADSAQPGAFRQESLVCQETSGDGLGQDLGLTVDTRGEVTGVSYLATTPAGDGSSLSCAVDASRDDRETEWSMTADETQVITWNDGEQGVDGGVVEPSRLMITRKGDLYTLDVQVQRAMFCGQSSALASRIELRRGQKTCAKVEF